MSGRRWTPARDAGFTLLEVMLALSIVGIMTTLMWSSFSQAARSKRNIEAAQDRTHTVRVALMRMAREIEMAYQSNAENTANPDRRTLLVSEPRGDVDELRFSAFAHQRLRAGTAEADTSVISYYGQRDPDDRSVLNLMRRETRRLQALDPKKIPGEAYILCPNVSRLKLSFWDFRQKQWREEWNTLGASGLPYLPSHVRISLSVYDERGQEKTFSTDARILMTEKVTHY